MSHIVVSGFSGVGKGTIVRELIRRYPDEYILSISATTRKPRPGEQNGREYFFISEEQFREMIANQEFLEYNQYGPNFYGTPRDFSRFLPDGSSKTIIFEIDIHGGIHIKEQDPSVDLVFILPPSVPELVKRLSGRGSETAEEIQYRLKEAKEETAVIPSYDYLIINDDLSEAVEELHHRERIKKLTNAEKLKIAEEMLLEFSKNI